LVQEVKERGRQMSGIKGTDWGLDPWLERLMQVRGDLAKMEESCHALRGMIESAQQAVSESIQSSQQDIRMRLGGISDALQGGLLQLAEMLGSLKTTGERLPSRTGTPKERNAITAAQGATGRMQQEIAGLQERVARLSDEAYRLTCADASLREALEQVRESGAHIASAEGICGKWMPAGYQQLRDEQENLERRLEETRSRLAQGQDAEAFDRELQAISRDARELKDKLVSLRSEAESKEDQQRRRMYVLRALRVVCGELGFHELEDPSYEDPEDRGTAVVQRFDTLDRGVITFRIHLDGRIESDSRIQLEACDEEHERISQLLQEEFGVITEFRRVGDDGLPEIMDAERMPLPRRRETRKGSGGKG